jgi:hypothetical protein
MSLQKTDEQFDDFFRDHLLGSEKELPEDGWKKLAPAVKKNNFFTFGFHHFNFYYILAALFLAVVFLFFFSENEIKIPAATSIENKSVTIPKEQNIPSSEETSVEKPATEIKREKEKQASSVKPTEVISSDTSAARQTPFVSVPDPVVEEKKPEVKSPTIKKIVTVIEQDTLIREDTVNVHRKRKRK